MGKRKTSVTTPKNKTKGFFGRGRKKSEQKKSKIIPISGDSDVESKKELPSELPQVAEFEDKHQNDNGKEIEEKPKTIIQKLVNMKKSLSIKDLSRSKNNSTKNLYNQENVQKEIEAKPPVPKQSKVRRLLRQLSSFSRPQEEETLVEELKPQAEPVTQPVGEENSTVEKTMSPQNEVKIQETTEKEEEEFTFCSKNFSARLSYIEEPRDNLRSSRITYSKSGRTKTEQEQQDDKYIEELTLHQERVEEEEDLDRLKRTVDQRKRKGQSLDLSWKTKIMTTFGIDTKPKEGSEGGEAKGGTKNNQQRQGKTSSTACYVSDEDSDDDEDADLHKPVGYFR